MAIDPKKAQALLEAKRYRETYGKLLRAEFPPKLWEFLNCTAHSAYLRGPNSGGKSYALAFFVAQVLLNRYHPSYTGWKPTKKANDAYDVVVWCLSKSFQTLRDALMVHLMGPEGNYGTGLIPKDAIQNITMGRGLGSTIDFATIKRDGGGLAQLAFRSYEGGREYLQSSRVSVVACDETFDDSPLLSELIARGAGVNGIFRLAATERLQAAASARYFYEGSPDERVIVPFSMDDITRIPEDERKRILMSYPEKERDSRYYGLPYKGAGSVWQTPIQEILIDFDPSKDIQPWHKHLISIDPSHFGKSDTASKFAALFWIWDEYAGTAIIHREILMKGGLADHYAALMAAGAKGIPIAWPHDMQQPQSDQRSIAQLYKEIGGGNLRMHPHWATFGPGKDGGFAREPGIAKINEMARGGRLKVAKCCRQFQYQWTAYERDENGQPLAHDDDLMSALRHGVMMLRIARPLPEFEVEFKPDRGREVKFPGAALGIDFDVFG